MTVLPYQQPDNPWRRTDGKDFADLAIRASDFVDVLVVKTNGVWLVITRRPAIDIAWTGYRRAGGEGAPLFETYAARLELDLVEAAPGGIVNAVRAATRESGEAADAALGLAILEGRKADAIREVSEAIAAWMGLLKQVQAMKGAPHA